MIKVTVPATSANIGAGFDSCGVALSLYNTATLSLHDSIEITAEDHTFTPQGQGNLIYRTAKDLFDLCGKPLPGLKIVQTNAIPMARGLGSSSACIAAGLLGANALLGFPLTNDDILTLATKLEGHPDNVAPALLGGFVVSVYEDGKVYSLQKDVAQSIVFAAFIPDFKLLTEKARAALPEEVAHKDAVYNLSRAALLAAAFCEERYELLPVVTKDSLHQQYRLPLIDGGREIFDLTAQLGAPATFISGAGPTILSVVPAHDTSFFLRAQAALQQSELLRAFTLHSFTAENRGAWTETPTQN